MKKPPAIRGALLLPCLAFAASLASPAHAQLSAFTYQGYLEVEGVPFTGEVDLEFRLADAPTDGFVLDDPRVFTAVPTTRGVFSVTLDFGEPIFAFAPLYLDILVDPDGAAGPLPQEPLLPRQPILSAPQAIRAASAGTADVASALITAGGAVVQPDNHSLDASDGSPSDALFVDAQGRVGIGTTTPSSPLQVRGAISLIDGFPQIVATQSVAGGAFSGTTVSQSFIVPDAGLLSEFQVKFNGGSVPLDLTVFAGGLQQPQAALGFYPALSGEFFGDDWTAFVLDPPVPVSAGGAYTVLLNNDVTGINLLGTAINLYADGETDAPGLADLAFRVAVAPAGEIRFPDGTRQATAFDGRGFALRQPAGGSSSPFLPVGPNPGTVTDTIEVSGTGQTFGPGTQLQVCVDITHGFSEDLVLTLEAPNGAQVLLAADEPGNIFGSVNYTNTCFASFATTSIVVANSPLTGTWRPEGSFAAFEGSPIDGPWTLIVEDTTTNDGGTLLGWSLQVPVEGITFPDGSVQVSAPPDGHSLDSAGGVPANVVFVDKDGEVGIGTTTPGFKFQVVGDAAKNTGASWTVASDIRLKDVSGPFARGLAALRGLQPILFHYQEGNAIGIPAGEDQVGVAAQDVQKLIPEAIVVHPSGYLHVNNDPIFWTVVNAVRELGDREDARDAEIERLRAENEELRERLARIEEMLAR